MRLVTIKTKTGYRAGFIDKAMTVVLPFDVLNQAAREFFPLTNEQLISQGPALWAKARRYYEKFASGSWHELAIQIQDVELMAPVMRPSSCRDGYAFRQHVEAARRNRKVPMIPEFDQYPVFYFTNHLAIQGPGPIACLLDHFDKLDYELEVAVVIGKGGRNIPVEKADEHIFGYTIMNDWSARTLQMEEMLLNLGPAKGKDFATSIGPVLVTPDELETYLVPPPPNHYGNQYNLTMTARVNGKVLSEGNTNQMDWTFAEIIERASYGVDLHPTDLIGSGTVGTGCLLELNGTALLNNPKAKTQWLQPGDVVELEVTELGVLKNTVVKAQDYSILAKKKPIAK